MTLSQQIRTPSYGDGLTYAGQDLRLITALLLDALGSSSGNALGIGTGVRDATGNPLKVAVASGLSVTVNAGAAAIQGSAALNAGAYTAVSDSTVTLTCSAADTVNPRIDSVCVTVTDLGSSSSNAVVQIITGTPASSPSAPALPSNSVLLCNITVAANATTLSSGNLSDQRQFIAANGAIKPVLNSGLYPTVGGSSMYFHDLALGRLKRLNSSGVVVAPSTVAFAPVTAASGNATANSTTLVNACSATVTVDGNTTVKLTVSWKYINTSSTTAGNGCVISATRGSTVFAQTIKYARMANDTLDGGGITWFDTPAAGTYTYNIGISTQGAGTFTLNSANLQLEAQPT